MHIYSMKLNFPTQLHMYVCVCISFCKKDFLLIECIYVKFKRNIYVKLIIIANSRRRL